MGTIVLTSNGIKGGKIKEELMKYITSDIKKAVIITTASEIDKCNDKHVPGLISDLQSFGLVVDLMDIEFESAEKLKMHDLVYLMGGNPFYLLKYLKGNQLKEIFELLLQKDKIIVGSSAGSVVLGPSIELVHEFEPDLNSLVGLTDFSGMGLTQVEISPHTTSFAKCYENFYERISKYKRTKFNSIELIDDGEAVVIDFDDDSFHRV